VDQAAKIQVVEMIAMRVSSLLKGSRCGVLAPLSFTADNNVQYFDRVWVRITINNVGDVVGNVR